MFVDPLPAGLLVLSFTLIVIAGIIPLLERRRETIARQRDEQLREYGLLKRAYDDLVRDEYIARSEVDEWTVRHARAYHIAKNPGCTNRLTPEFAEQYQSWSRFFQYLPETVRLHNARFIERRMLAEQHHFENSTKGSLTFAQRRAICTNQNATLVIAGAGTGKTETIVGKIEYLVRRGLAQSSDILAMSFSNKSTDELAERVRPVAGIVQISTLHSLSLEIIRVVEGRRPDISPLSESDGHNRRRFVRETLGQLLTTESGQLLMRRFFASDSASQAGSDRGAEVWRSEYSSNPVAITGHKLKSKQELLIANWLTYSGISWVYEQAYPVETESTQHRRYRPDFYLPEHDIFIEHFGIDRDGNTAAGIDATEYRKQMEWKQKLHRTHGTTLVETYSYQGMEGTLLHDLEQRLAVLGVVPNPLTQEQIAVLIDKANRPFSYFVQLLARFISCFKGNGEDRDQLQSRANSAHDRDFLSIFWMILEAYEEELRHEKQVDFDDLINRAQNYVTSGKYASPYTYIIVDEFQDMSAHKLALIEALRKQHVHGRLFAVGDDWQSIYRFSGSDLSILTDLNKYTDAVARVDLDTTFRFSQELLEVSSRFILANDAQLRKSLVAHKGAADRPPIALVYDDFKLNNISIILRDIIKQAKEQKTKDDIKVLMLSRYNSFDREQLRRIYQIQSEFLRHNLVLDYTTVHKAKGTEADYVIVIDLKSGDYSFPSTISDDPVMNLVLSKPEPFPFAEERRLFYVAMTRARNRVYLVAPEVNTSIFVEQDLLKTELREFVDIIGPPSPKYQCPECNERTIVHSANQYGEYWPCRNTSGCFGQLYPCENCHQGIVVKHILADYEVAFVCNKCGAWPEMCPMCGSGYLRQFKGKYGAFLGCSRYQKGRGCSYKRDIR